MDVNQEKARSEDQIYWKRKFSPQKLLMLREKTIKLFVIYNYFLHNNNNNFYLQVLINGNQINIKQEVIIN